MQQEETAMDIAIRKSFKEVQEILANPPALKEREGPTRKQDKASSQSLESKESQKVKYKVYYIK